MIRESNANGGALLPTAYQPSLLRRFPVIAFCEAQKLRSPLPALIFHRVTSGLYYDLIDGGGSHLRNEVAGRFETYSGDFIAAMMPRFEVVRSYKYRFRRNSTDTPDLLVSDGGKIVIAIECKATKLTFDAQFADDPIAVARREHDEIAKGVFQLWRYFSHVRRGIIASDTVCPNAHGIVLTLDSWLLMTDDLQEQLYAAATALAAKKDPEITAEDRRKVVFCSIQDLEITIANSHEDSFLRTISAAREDRFSGWMLPNVHREMGGFDAEPKPFPFEIRDVLPWWGQIEDSDRRDVA